jgi:hypothetical protein
MNKRKIDKPIKRAYLCGINYKGTDAELNGCVNDIANINNFLVQKCGYSPANIRITTDHPGFGIDIPEKQTIENNLSWLVRDCIPGDTLLFYYSGHGSDIKDRSGDESDGLDSVLVPLDYKKKGVITDDWIFQNIVSKIPLGVTLWAFTDCCNSGTMLDLQFNLQSNCVYQGEKFKHNIEYKNEEWSNQYSILREKSKLTQAEVYFFSGCLDPQTAADATIRNQAQGAFTACLLQILNRFCVNVEGIPSFQPKNLRLIDLLKEINCRLVIQDFEQRSQLSMGQSLNVTKLFTL